MSGARLVRAAAGRPAELQTIYGIAGQRRLTELELPWLLATRTAAPCASATPRLRSCSSTSTAS